MSKAHIPVETKISKDERAQIETGIYNKYIRVAKSPQGLFSYPTGSEGLSALKYDPAWIKALPESVRSSYCGVGNPFSMGKIHKNEKILDMGCGAGVDTLIAGILTGANGKAYGVDLTPEMLERAEINRRKTSLDQVIFQRASGEKLPFENDFFDVVISNGVMNLIPDKRAVLKETFRVLKPKGRLMIADQFMTDSQIKDIKERVKSWFQ